MPKNILRDIISSERKTIRQIPLSNSRRRDVFSPEASEEIRYERHEEEYAADDGPQRGKNIWLWGISILGVLLLVAVLFSNLGAATVTVTPKSVEAIVSGSFTASKAASQDGALRFETVPLERAAEVTIAAEQTKKVSEKASGTIIVYNNYGTAAQRLIKNTRFETPKGLIYRIDRSIVVPGRSVVGGKTTPGSVEAVVYADSPGAEYNSGLVDFTIPGFKSDPGRYAGFYARAKTPLSGGIDDMVRTPSEEAERAAREGLRKQLAAEVRKEAAASVPDEFVLFDGALALAFESVPVALKGADKALVTEKARGNAYLFRRSELAKAIAKAAVKSYNNLPVEIPGIEALSFSFGEPPDVKNPAAGASEIAFKLSGDAKIIWLFDENSFAGALRGKQKSELAGILGSFPTIEKVEVSLRPFWKKSFPEGVKKIKIKIEGSNDTAASGRAVD